MKLRNVFVIVFAVSTALLLASHYQVRAQYAQLKDGALTFRQDCNWFSMDVMAVDARTGEAVPRAVLEHPADYPLDAAAQMTFPRLSRVYSPEEGCTKVSGLANAPVRLVMKARDYEETEFEIVPDRSHPNQPALIVKLERKAPDMTFNGLSLSKRSD